MFRKISLIFIASQLGLAANLMAQSTPPAPTDYDDTTKNLVMISSSGGTNPQDDTIEFRGTGPDTVASELIGYLKAAGTAGGVTSFQDPEKMNYQFDQISGFVAAHVAPHQEVQFKGSRFYVQTSKLDSGKMKTEINTWGASDDLDMTLMKLMKAAGVTPLRIGMSAQDVQYKGKNISCVTFTDVNLTLHAQCRIIFDPSL